GGHVADIEGVGGGTERRVMVYNIPSRVVINIAPETMAQLADISNVTSVKQANADIEEAQRIVELGLDLYAGDDNIVHPFLEVGGRGGVCVHTHVVGPQVKAMVRRFRAGDAEGAKRAADE